MVRPSLRVVRSSNEQLLTHLPSGKLVELSGQSAAARSSTAVSLLHHLQEAGETAAWIQPQGGALFPPDLALNGIDLDAVAVIHVPVTDCALPLCKAAELLLRSGAFGLVVIDLADAPPLRAAFAGAWQGRLQGLARQHESRVLLLTSTPAQKASLGPLIGLRIETRRTRESSGRFWVSHDVLKNKAGAPFEPADRRYRGPSGLS